MKKYFKLLILAILVIGLSYCSYKIISINIQKEQLEKDLLEKQHNLGEFYGVSVDDYPPSEIFPIGYFRDLLVPGMSIQEVHNEITGYEKVIHNKTLAEIYYFFYEDDSKAIRIKLRYDENGFFTELTGEDKDSGMFSTKNYQLGQIEE